MKLAFILYDSRSGSTLFAALLNQYKGIHVTPETHYPSRLYSMPDSWFKNNRIDKIIDDLYSEVQFTELEINRNDLISEIGAIEELTRAQIIELITPMAVRDKSHDSNDLFVIKHSPTVHLKRIKAEIPYAKFIYIVRDPRGVYASKKTSLNLQGNAFEKNPYAASLNWLVKYNFYSNLENVNVVKYEDIVQSRSKTVESIVEELVGQVEKVRSVKGYSEKIGAKQMSFHQNVGGEVLRNKDTDWEDRLNRSEIFAIQNVCSNEIKKLDYPILEHDTHIERLTFLFTSFEYRVTYVIRSIKPIFQVLRGDFSLLKAKWFKLRNGFLRF